MDRDQRIRDPVHNLVKFTKGMLDDELLWDLIQTRPVQRLRRIKQLGFTDFVYPAAGHTRFSHSIGAMQMARRMLDVLERNKVFKASRKDHQLWRRATQCAALLHDVGHGPFSHVFEELSKSLGLSIDHEDYTRELIRNGEIKKLLTKGHVLEKVGSFFEKEPGSFTYSAIVSSQLDADRLDFLARDRYFTGIEGERIDLEWLFDSLVIIDVPIETGSPVKEYVFAIKAKGLAATENYLLAYANMYKAIYFHKTTRAVQFMALDILKNIFGKPNRGKGIPKGNALRRYFDEAPKPSLESFLNLDDDAVIEVIRAAAVGNLGEASALARRYLNRSLYKPWELPRAPKGSVPQVRFSKFLESLKGKHIFYHMDVVPVKQYKQFAAAGQFLKNILVFSDYDREYKAIGHISEVISERLPESPVRLYFKNAADRERAKKLWGKAA